MAWALQAGTCIRNINVFIRRVSAVTVCLQVEAKPILLTGNQSMKSGKHGTADCFTSFIGFHNLLSTLSPPSSDDTSSDEDVSHCVLVPRGCPPSSSPTVVPCVSPSINIPSQSSLSCSPNGTLVFSSSPSSCLPPLPCGSVPRRSPSQKQDISCSQGSLRLSHSNRNSAASLHSMSTCSDTSYILGR